MATQDMSTAAAAALAAYEARDRAKTKSDRRNPLYGYAGLIALALGVGLYFLIHWWMNRPPPLDAPAQVLATYMSSAKFDNQSAATQQRLRDAFNKKSRDEQQAAIKALNEDQRDSFVANQWTGPDPSSDWGKRQAEMQKEYLAAGTSADKRALMEKMSAERRAQRQARAASQPTSQPAGGGWGGGGGGGAGGGWGGGGGGPGGGGPGGGPGGPGGGGPGGGGPGGMAGGPGAGFGPGGAANPVNREVGTENRIDRRELRAEGGR